MMAINKRSSNIRKSESRRPKPYVAKAGLKKSRYGKGGKLK